jgi:hypothetical protein
MAIGKGARLLHAADVVACQLDGGNALLDLASSDYYRLNGTAATVWDGIGEGLAVPQIVERILSEYDVEQDQCASDVDAIISALLDAGLVVVAD